MHIIFVSTACFVFFIFTFFSIYYISKTNTEIHQNIDLINQSVISSIDSKIKQMDNISINTVYSNNVKHSFLELSNTASKEGQNISILSEKSNETILYDFIYAIIGADINIKQVNIYGFDSKGFGAGIYNGTFQTDISEISWFDDVVKKHGKKHITSAFSKPFFSKSNDQYISLCRSYYDSYNNLVGVVEIAEYYDYIFSAVQDVDCRYSPTFYIFDENGRLLFPQTKLSEDISYLYDISNQETNENTYFINKNLLSVKKSSYCGLTSILLVDAKNFYYPMIILTLSLFIIILFLTFICYYIARRISIKISTPLLSLNYRLNKSDISTISDANYSQIEKSNIIEIDDLTEALSVFQTKTKSSMDEILLLQQKNSQAQLIAMQSQMNPHFIFNSLATIQIMIRNNMNKEADCMFDSIIEILRYISADNNNYVQLEEELNIVDLYLCCIENRFQKNISYKIQIDDDLLAIPVPKLCIQPLVENSIKYCTESTNPPWKIEVICEKNDEMWLATVYDNGVGFSTEILDQLKKSFDHFDKKNVMPTTELQGTGLINLYVRLNIIYKSNYIFEIGHDSIKGTYVKIGGSLNGNYKQL